MHNSSVSEARKKWNLYLQNRKIKEKIAKSLQKPQKDIWVWPNHLFIVIWKVYVSLSSKINS